MTEYFDAVRNAVVTKRDRLNELLERLDEFRAANANGGAEPTEVRLTKTRGKKPGRKKIANRKSTIAEPKGKASGRLMEAVATLYAPFDGTMLGKAMGIDARQAQAMLRYAAKQGNVVLTEAGKPGYPAKYRHAGSPAKTRRVAEEDEEAPSRASLERKLKDAQSGLADAKRKGEVTLAGILTDKVARLQADLDALTE